MNTVPASIVSGERNDGQIAGAGRSGKLLRFGIRICKLYSGTKNRDSGSLKYSGNCELFLILKNYCYETSVRCITFLYFVSRF